MSKKDKKKRNEINIIININESDINKDIYFLDNIDDIDDEKVIKLENDKLKEMNESNTYLYINEIYHKFQKYYKFNKIGEYHIKLKFLFLTFHFI